MPVMLAAIGRFLVAFALHSAASRTRSMTSSFGVSTAILSFGNSGGEVAHHEGDFGVRFGRRRVVGRGGAAGRGFREQALRIERRDIGGEIGHGQRQIAGDAHEGAHADDFVVADPRHGGDADHLAGERWLFRGRQPVALARRRAGSRADAERAAQRHLDPFGQRGEIGFAVERRENGAAHQSSAAQCGQDRAGKPLHRNAAAIDEAAVAAVDRQRRFVAEIDGLGSPRSICAARPCLVQALPSPAPS